MSARTWFVIHESKLLVRRDGERVLLPTDADAEQLGIDPSSGHSVGSLHGAAALAASLAALPSAAHPYETVGLRALAALLDAETFGLAGRAMHVVDWTTTSQFCGRCGTPTVLAAKERNMACPACGLSAYPRIAPAIIVLVRRGEQALLARNARFPGAFYSTLAGFSEIGESLEETLAREVREEVGIGVRDIRYFGSQPWPFPHSLMIGFTAEWAEGEIAVDGDEIADARWFSADELPMIPPPLSIARRLIDAWVAEVGGRVAEPETP
ncbi:MAG: pyrophosphatase [Labilithrix sp.]|nr:pyrophosphatase [Labilithrix sp.]